VVPVDVGWERRLSVGAGVVAKNPVGFRQEVKLLVPHVAVEQPSVHQDDGRLTRSGDLVIDLALAELGNTGLNGWEIRFFDGRRRRCASATSS